MSIPGLGQIPAKPAPSGPRTYRLQPCWEYRFQVAHGSTITIILLDGTAERDGTELAATVPYKLSGTKSKLLSWRGATISVDGPADDCVAETGDPTTDSIPSIQYLNLHTLLSRQRDAASRHGGAEAALESHGPRVLIAGPASSGKTTLVRTLAAWATRMGSQPIVVNTNPKEGILSLPGTLSAAVFGTLMDVTSEAGWGSAPSSGPGAVPVKLPLVYYYGRQWEEENPALWNSLVSSLAAAVGARVLAEPEVRTAGLLIDSPSYMPTSGVDALSHLVEEFSVNIIVVLGSDGLTQELTRRFMGEKTSLGERISVVGLDKSDGVIERGEGFLQHSREASIKEYFFGDSRLTLSPFTQLVGFDDVAIYRSPEPTEYDTRKDHLEKIEPSPEMTHWTLAIMNAALHDTPEKIRHASVMGFVYVAGVDKDRRRLKILAPVSGRIGDKPMVWSKWPEPHINLLG